MEPDMDINKFCDQNHFDAWLRKPSNFKDKTIATNSHVMVSVPRMAGAIMGYMV